MKSKSIIITAIIVIVVAAAGFYGRTLYHKSHLSTILGRHAVGGQSDRMGSEGEIPQSGDLCGGTGGNGQIASLENNTFIMKRNDNGSSQIIHLTDQATIKTSAGSGSASESDLKTGDRVTLVGGPNPDGSFTAYGVFICSGTYPTTQLGK